MSDEAVVACKLLPGLTGVLVQVLLMVCCFLLLVLKKRIEVKYSNRTWGEFALDSSKQVISSLWLHVLNLFFAVQFHKRNEVGDSCDWYWVNIVVDCTVGTGIEYALFVLIMHVIIPAVLSKESAPQYQSGEYGGHTLKDFRWKCYYKQLVVWLVICTLMKIAVVEFMRLFKKPLIVATSAILQRFNDDPNKKLTIVMIVSPLLFNTIQLWIIDNILRRNEQTCKNSLVTKLLAV